MALVPELTGRATPAPGQRPLCAHCGRPLAACLCPWVTPIAQEIEVLILQHPLEVSHPKGSARLLHLSLPGSRLLVGERFDPAFLKAALGGTRRSVLLYPDSPGPRLPSTAGNTTMAPATAMGSSSGVERSSRGLEPDATADERVGEGDGEGDGGGASKALRLVVLDGTWRKSRKMLHLNPALQALPRLALRDMPASRYLIRKAHRPDQMSTLEATCAALAQLNGRPASCDGLLRAFDCFMAHQQQALAPQSPRSITPASGTLAGGS